MENKQEFNYPSLTRQCYSQDENSRLKAINVPLTDFLGLKNLDQDHLLFSGERFLRCHSSGGH